MSFCLFCLSAARLSSSLNDEFSLLTVFERRKVNCEFADSQLAYYPDPHCTSVGNVRAASCEFASLQVCESASLRVYFGYS